MEINGDAPIVARHDIAIGAQLERFAARVADSGEGRWTLQAANEEGVPAHVLTSALFARFASRREDEFQNRLLLAMRLEFGGHMEQRSIADKKQKS